MKIECATRLEWLKARQNGIGGSDISAIAGKNPWRSGFDVWLSKKEPILESQLAEETAAQMRGRLFESAVCNWYEEQTGFRMIDPGNFTIHQNEQHPFMLATADRFAVNPNTGEEHGVEAKTARSHDGWGAEDSQDIPEPYMHQVQWYMKAYGKRRWDVCAYFAVQDRFARYQIDAQDWMQDALVELGENWWEKYVIGNNPPPMTGTEGEKNWIDEKFPFGSGRRDATPEEEELMSQIMKLKQKQKELSKDITQKQNQLKNSIGDDERIDAAKFRATWKNQTARRIDSKGLRKSHPNLAEEFTKESESRVLRISEHRVS